MKPWGLNLSAQQLTRLAAVWGLIAVLMMALSILVPSALIVVLAMSVGQLIGGLAFACYLYAIITEMRRNQRLARAALAKGDSAEARQSRSPNGN